MHTDEAAEAGAAKRLRVTSPPALEEQAPAVLADGGGALFEACFLGGYQALIEAWEGDLHLAGRLPATEVESLPTWVQLCSALGGEEGPRQRVDALPFSVAFPPEPPALFVGWAGEDGAPAAWPNTKHGSDAALLLTLGRMGVVVAPLRRLQLLLDDGWRGEGSISAALLLGGFSPASASCLALPAHSRQEDVLLVVLDGLPRIKTGFPPPAEAPVLVADFGSTPWSVRDPTVPWIGELLTLRRGDILYLPSGTVWEVGGLQGGAMAVYTLPRQVQQDDLMPALLRELQPEEEGQGHRRFPHAPGASAPAARLCQTLQAMLRAGPSFAERLPGWLDQQLAPRMSAPQFDIAACLARHGDLEALLEGSEELLVIQDFLPPPVAQRMREALLACAECEWQPNEGEGEDDGVAHAFRSSSAFPHSANIFEAMQGLFPRSRCVFQAGRYDRPADELSDGSFIARHDDSMLRRFPRFLSEEYQADKSTRLYRRSVAVVLHLTAPEWREEHGGCFVDYGPGDAGAMAPDAPPLRLVVPTHNTLVAFRVPRVHEVTAVAPDAPAGAGRLSLFGWSYELAEEKDEKEEEEEEEEEEGEGEEDLEPTARTH